MESMINVSDGKFCFNLINILFQAKEEALHELRNAHPNQEISLHLPDHCSEHLEKINQV